MARYLRRRARLVRNSPPRCGLLTQRLSFAAVACLAVLLTGCADPGSDAFVLTADLPLHLEDHLDVATIEGSEVPADAPPVLEWQFDEPQEDWKPVVPWNPTIDPVEVTQLDDALRVTLTDGTKIPDGRGFGGLVLQVPDWNAEDLAYLVLRARRLPTRPLRCHRPHRRGGWARCIRPLIPS